MAEQKMILVDLDQPLPGQRRFISCWAVIGDERTFVVDPGPTGTAGFLISELEKAGVRELDFILLTHIHLDHGGGTAELLKRWPAAKVICHKIGRPHIVDPSRLWEGSLSVLGHKAEVYGQPGPVPESCLAEFSYLQEHEISVLPTPGHAPHHLCFLYQDTIFVGEAAGTFSDLGLDPVSANYYLRPATPPRFFPEVALKSLDLLRAAVIEHPIKRLAFAHYGQFTGDLVGLLTEANEQLLLWIDISSRLFDQAGGKIVLDDNTAQEALYTAIQAELSGADTRFARKIQLPDDIQSREIDFTRQTLRGILGHLSSLK